MNEIISKIDVLLSLMTEKGINKPYLYEDLRLVLLLTIVKIELSVKGKVSDNSFCAMVTIAGCSYQDYKGVHDKIHDRLILIEELLYQFNDNPFKGDIVTPSCHDKKEWEIFLKKILTELLVMTNNGLS